MQKCSQGSESTVRRSVDYKRIHKSAHYMTRDSLLQGNKINEIIHVIHKRDADVELREEVRISDREIGVYRWLFYVYIAIDLP